MGDTAFNPLTGDPAFVTTKAARYTEIAKAIERSVATLEAIRDGDDNRSDAIDQLKESAENVARDIGKAKDRYRLTADALSDYAVAFQEAADDADAAITAIDNARDAATTAGTSLHLAQERADADDAPDSADDTVTQRQDAYDDAVTAVGNAEQLWYDARDAKASAANTAEGLIDDVVNGDVGDELNDSWWDNIGDILDVVKVICEIAGVLAIFLSWVPILGQVLVALAILGAIITLVDACVKLSRGEGSIADVVFAALGVVLTAFGGKALSYLGKLTKMSNFAKIAQAGKFKPWGFKNISGISKANMPGELAKLQGLKGFMNEVVKKVFSGSKPFSEFIKNPAGLQLVDDVMDLSKLSLQSKVILGVIDVQTVTSKIEKLINITGVEVNIDPQGLIIEGLQGGGNAIEDGIRDAVGR